MIKKIISVRIRILEFFLPLFEKLSVIYGDFFWPIFWWNLMAFCLSFPKWCNTYTLAEKIKALEHQTFSTHFTSKFMLFWITQKLTFFTHPNIKIGKNGNAPIHRRGFHVFFKNSWPSFTHLRPDIMALVQSRKIISIGIRWHNWGRGLTEKDSIYWRKYQKVIWA